MSIIQGINEEHLAAFTEECERLGLVMTVPPSRFDIGTVHQPGRIDGAVVSSDGTGLSFWQIAQKAMAATRVKFGLPATPNESEG